MVDPFVITLEVLRVEVLDADAIDDVCDGSGGRIVAELGVGNSTVAES